MLATVRQGTELGEAEEAAVALDRVDSAKNARQSLGIVGAFLERDQVAVELIEALARFDEKFLDEFAVITHPRPSSRWRIRCRAWQRDGNGRRLGDHPFEAYTPKTAPTGYPALIAIPWALCPGAWNRQK